MTKPELGRHDPQTRAMYYFDQQMELNEGDPAVTAQPLRLRDFGPQTFALHSTGRFAEALRVVIDGIESLHPDDLPTATFWKICLLNRIGDQPEAINTLGAALRQGWWYGEEMLRHDDDLATLRGIADWDQLVADSMARQVADRTKEPTGQLIRTETEQPIGSVIALHAGGGRVTHTADVWRSVTTRGYDLHVPGSSQRISHDRSTWSDRDLAFQEINKQVTPGLRAKRLFLVGRSQGASRAAQLAAEPWAGASGVVMVALAPRVEDAPDVETPVYAIVGVQDRPEFLDRVDDFAAYQSGRGRPIHVERVGSMGHEYPYPFDPLLNSAIDWLEAHQAV